MIKTMTIDKKLKPAMNVAIRDILGPTAQTKIVRKTTMIKVTTRTRIMHEKNQPKKRKIRRNQFNLYRT